MKIFLPFKLQDIGGTSTFAAKFKAGLEKQGHTVSFETSDDYDLLFMIVQAPLEYLQHARRYRKPIIQRLDGVWYWSVAGWKYPLLNAKATYIRHLFADLTIYQSEYSKQCAQRFLGKKENDRSAIIYNGVDLGHFAPVGEKLPMRDNPNQQVFLTASAFRRTDQILPLIAALELYRKRVNMNCKLVIAGSFVGEVADIPDRYQSAQYLQFLGKVKNADLPAYERAADVFVFSHLNPPCPNNIIEAMACGLPICGYADGAMAELVVHGENGLLLTVQGTGFWRKRTIDPAAFAHNLADVIQHAKKFGQASRRLAEKRFGLDTMIDQYTQAFKELV
jgi:glycosyltransferase involved in cell wall biosynthesis